MSRSHLVDVAGGVSAVAGALAWVGMERIALPLRVADGPVNGRASVGVNLTDPAARGIHMSRLYLALAELAGQELTLSRAQSVLASCLDSHQALSDAAFLDLAGDALLERPALISPLAGWKAYPFALRCRQDAQGVRFILDLTVGYSSTCPCSAALARQSIQEAFDADFTDTPLTRDAVRAWLGSEEGIVATPHSQRSQAHLSVRLADGIDALPLPALVECVEGALGTALQTAVKRVDEQAFALANGRNLMFCEDAARRVHGALEGHDAVQGFQVRIVHAESLHAHDAVARSAWNWGPDEA
ncbi:MULTISPECIES: GTP cyclohydrolase FolE2 [unclassified Modicisalibacter]|uniref:GTP cyclohydrolase FolE2 n=1 Tax=unclassified Modicisalibacter TaxID=2679913 RepID=UPI001CCD0A8B|nr:MULTISPECIES: GTP cyclohydrolase FolE2 [unclassified Modicisalibacter]MBZ9558455.1 GTP cyclohydrolase I FolE2 [Modicisalibacter sp. R2A 31.J]MBZ9575653.1 GTP cyclohydrolase I FolE2 [Modicisalibacter sp. MOD 31.J]